MKLTGLLAVALLFVASLASAQSPSTACGVQGQQTQVFGCLDAPVAHAVVGQAAVVLQGWALSCYTGQQPSDVQVWYLDRARQIRQADPSTFSIAWRTYRPDVLAYFQHYCNVSSPWLGYALTVRGLPLGETVVAVLFTDPAIGVGVVNQQVPLTVVP